MEDMTLYLIYSRALHTRITFKVLLKLVPSFERRKLTDRRDMAVVFIQI